MIGRLALLCALLCLPLAASGEFDHRHGAWGALLKKHVVLVDGGKTSQVRYGGFKQDRAELKRYLETLGQVSRPDFQRWSSDQQLAFLINAYNAATVEKVLTRYPDIRSIWDFGKLIGNPFKDRFIRLLGADMSLDDIEHDTIRADGAYNDPRIHFAVNCASVGCPMLREEPYLADRLDAQLEDQTVRFLSDRTRNRFNPTTKTLEVSKIFDRSPWYGGDFRRGWKGFTSLETFFARYADRLADSAQDQRLIRDSKAAIRHLDYDWALNAVRS